MDEHRIKVGCLGRQSGKSAMGGFAALLGHGPIGSDGRPLYRGALDGATIQWTSKDFPNSTKIWKELKHYLRHWPDLDKSEVERCITFPGGGQVFIRSGHDPDSLRGPTLDGAINDELAFWHKDSLETLRPALAVKQGWEIDLSTPMGFNWFHDEWRRGAEGFDPDYASWQWPSSVNPAFAADEFERLRRKTNPLTFAREYLAEFAVTDGELFRREWFRYYRQDDEWIYPELGERVRKDHCHNFLAADFALTAKDHSDHTAILVVTVAADGRMFARDMVHARLKPSEVVPLLLRLQDRWQARFTYVEKSGAGVHLNEDAARAGVRIRERSIHRKVDGNKGEDKVERANKASEAVELGRIMFPRIKQPNGGYSPPLWVGDLIAECCAFTGEKGGRDDQVDALSLGVLGSAFIQPRSIPQSYRSQEDDEQEQGRWLVGR